VVSRSGALTVTQASNAAQLPARVASVRHTDGVRDVRFSYADPAFPLPKRAIIRAIEGVTGQPLLKRLYLENRRRPVPGETFFAAAVRQLQLDIRFDPKQLEKIPKTGPCIVVANHPYGVLDGLVIGWLIGSARPDFLILTHALLMSAPEVRPYLLPVDFSSAPEALRTNLNTRSKARAHLDGGGCVVVFPAGAVSTSPDRLGRGPAVDAPWQPFTAQLVQRSKADVVPIFFGGQNSRVFQIASHFNMVLRLSLIFKEVRDRIGTTLPVAIGDPIPQASLSGITSRHELAAELMARTYALAGKI
jgi:putative hemolysin